MRLENMVCSFEHAKTLKRLGVAYPTGQESPFIWMEVQGITVDEKELWHPGIFRKDNGGYDYLLISELPFEYDDEGTLETRGWWNAFNISEMATMIGKGTSAAALVYDAVQDQMNRSHSFTICYSPQFLANCLISLLETGRITPEECNKRLTES